MIDYAELIVDRVFARQHRSAVGEANAQLSRKGQLPQERQALLSQEKARIMALYAEGHSIRAIAQTSWLSRSAVTKYITQHLATQF